MSLILELFFPSHFSTSKAGAWHCQVI